MERDRVNPSASAGMAVPQAKFVEFKMSVQPPRPRRTSPPGFMAVAAIALLVAACDPQRLTGPGDGPRPPRVQAALAAGSPTSIDVFIHAHQDDWQLFMGDKVYHALQNGDRIVFVYATAGDAGREQLYWETREAAVQASVDSIAGPGAWSCATQTISTHPIRRCTKANTVSYYMRMPGGNGSDGLGYGKGSLERLRDSAQATTAIDGSTTYQTWSDFYTTVGRIVEFESSDPLLASVKVHAPDYSRTLNPNDHPDHWVTADAVQAAAAPRGWSMSWYVDYETRNKSINLSTADHDIKQKEFYAYDDVMYAAGYETLKTDSWYQAWLWRTYLRVVQPGAPSAPSSLSATAASTSQIDLVWRDNSGNESGFKIERAPDVNGAPGTYAQIAVVGTNVTGYSDTGLDAGTRYWYRVRAYNGAGNSGYSNAASATTTVLAGPPAAPSNLAATALSSAEIGLTWTDNAANETEYRVHRSTTAGFTPDATNQIATLAAGSTSYDDSGLTPSTTYYYRVVAANSAGTAASNEASATTPAALQLPSAPTNLVATAASGSQIDLAWNDNASNESGFRIERAPDVSGAPGTYAEVAVVGANVTGYSDAGLAAGTRYWYRVRAYNTDGNSAYSNAVAARTNDVPPSNLTVVRSSSGAKAKGSNKAQLSWTKGTAPSVDLWRNGSRIAAGTSNSGSYSDNLGNKVGTFSYQVCLAGKTGTANCSNAAQVTF